MKIYIISNDCNSLIVIARNYKTCMLEMKKSYPMYEFAKTLQMAKHLTGDLGLYEFQRINTVNKTFSR